MKLSENNDDGPEKNPRFFAYSDNIIYIIGKFESGFFFRSRFC